MSDQRTSVHDSLYETCNPIRMRESVAGFSVHGAALFRLALLEKGMVEAIKYAEEEKG